MTEIKRGLLETKHRGNDYYKLFSWRAFESVVEFDGKSTSRSKAFIRNRRRQVVVETLYFATPQEAIAAAKALIDQMPVY